MVIGYPKRKVKNDEQRGAVDRDSSVLSREQTRSKKLQISGLINV